MRQRQLAEALVRHAANRGVTLDLAEAALEMFFRFLEEEQVGMLLRSPEPATVGADASPQERALVAEFVQNTVKDDPALLLVLQGMLEGLVLYHAAFLPDLSQASRRFKDLRVIFDSTLVRQALGYEGSAMRTLMRETIDLLKAGDVRCLVFDKTVLEIKRILGMFEARLATTEGCRSLRPTSMTRQFLIQRYSPSDVREMSALLEREIAAAGFQIVPAPKRERAYTAGESALARRFADQETKDELEPRVVHDVDCVAGALTFRRGHRSASLDDSRAVFATDSPLVIRNTRLWWLEDEQESGIEPVVHIRALSNVAWLKKPSLCSEFKVRELVALCTAALRPTQRTWERFLRHLESLHKSRRLDSDQVAAIVVSAMSDELLRDAEVDEDDPSDIDAQTLDEVVDRVEASYTVDTEKKLHATVEQYEAKIVDLETRERAAAERAAVAELRSAEQVRRQLMVNEGRARTCAYCLAAVLQWTIVIPVVIGAIAVLVVHPFHRGWLGVLISVGAVSFVALELLGVLKHVSQWRASTEARLTKQFREWLAGETQAGQPMMGRIFGRLDR